MKRTAASFFSTLVFASLLFAADLSTLLHRVKDQFRLGSYDRALITLGELDSQSGEPGLETERAALTPVLAFYRGACLAGLGRNPESIAEFQTFLAFQPNASLDPAVYPKKVIAAFEEARRALPRRADPTLDGSVAAGSVAAGSVAASYRAFPAPSREEQVSLGDDWAEGPVRLLLSANDERAFNRLSDPISRSEFVTAFWKSRDPKPETPENEFREEFEKRVSFSNARFTQGETAGSLTDRGMVFILLGAPTYVGRKPLTSGEDSADRAALFQYRPSDVRIASTPGGKTSDRAARVDRVTGPGSKMNEAAANWREVWHYRRENLPRGIPYLQVDFEFVTKLGYGENVLQRDTQVLDTLEKAKARLRQAAA